MTSEEMQDPEGTLKARRNNLVWPTGSDTGGIPNFLEGMRGEKLDPNITKLSDWQQQQGILGGFGTRKQPPADLTRALQAGVGSLNQSPYQQALQGRPPVGSLQGQTQQKIKEGYQV